MKKSLKITNKISKRGISIIIIAITIVIMIILSGSIVSIGADEYKKASLTNVSNELYTIKNSIEDYYFKNSKYPILETREISLDYIKDEELEQFKLEDNYLSKNITLDIIDLSKINVQEVNKGIGKDGDNDYFAYSSKTKSIYYLKGYKIKNNRYYTITDELYELIQIKNVE